MKVISVCPEISVTNSTALKSHIKKLSRWNVLFVLSHRHMLYTCHTLCVYTSTPHNLCVIGSNMDGGVTILNDHAILVLPLSLSLLLWLTARLFSGCHEYCKICLVLSDIENHGSDFLVYPFSSDRN